MTTSEEPPTDEPDLSQASADEALRYILDAAVAGNGALLYDALTSTGYVDMLHIAKEIGMSKILDAYRIDAYTVDGEDHRFAVQLDIAKKKLASTTTMRKQKNEWRIVSVKVPGVRD